MFTLTKTLNPLSLTHNYVSKYTIQYVCVCGSSDVRKSYVHDSRGEVDGIRLSCRTCARSEAF